MSKNFIFEHMTDTILPVSARPPVEMEMLEPPLQHSDYSIQPWAPSNCYCYCVVVNN